MNAKEFRIGNRVLADGIPSIVMAITANGKIAVKTDRWRQVDMATQVNDNSHDCKTVEPMPLTLDLLKAYGFVFDEAEWLCTKKINTPGEHKLIVQQLEAPISPDYPTDFIWPIRMSNPDSKRVDNIKMDIMYLHQLQNLYFALTGKELEVDL